MTLIVDFGRALGQMGDPRFLRVLFGALLPFLPVLAELLRRRRNRRPPS